MSETIPAFEIIYCTETIGDDICGSVFVPKKEELDMGDVWVRGACLGMNEQGQKHALNCPKWMLRAELVGVDLSLETDEFPAAEDV
jgi:hypothetical protein